MRTTGSTIPRAFARILGTVTAVSLAFLGLVVPSAGAAELTVCASGCDYTAIQPAVDAASAGDTITVGEGTFAGVLTIDKRLTIRGAGATTILSGGPTTVEVTAPVDGTARVVLEDLTLSGFTTAGIRVSDLTTLQRVTITGGGIGTSTYDVWLPGLRPVSDVAIIDSTLSAAGSGLKIPSTTAVDGLTIDGTTIQGTQYGIYADAPGLSGQPGVDAAPIQNVRIEDSSFLSNTTKGIYFERLSHAVLTGLTFTDNGSAASAASRGLNLNLKYGDYTDIAITDSTFAGNGTGTTYGAAITVAARNDGSYAGNPATLSDLTISGVTVSGSPVAMSIENDVDLATTTVANTRLTGYAVAGLGTSGTDAGTLLATTNAFDRAAAGYDVAALSGSVDASLNAWGDPDGALPARLMGTVTTSPWIHDFTDDPTKAGEPGFWPVDVTFASTPVSFAGGEDPAPATFDDPASGASISIDLPATEAGGTLAVETLTKPGADVAGATFSAGSAFFDIAFDGTMTDPATICLTYPGGGNWPVGTKLYHYEGGAWNDVTTSLVDGLLCGAVTSFSPFAAGIVTLGTSPDVANVTATPETQPYGGDVTVTADATDADGNETITAVEYTVDAGATWHAMTFTSGTSYTATIVKPDVGDYTVSVRATDADANVTADAEDSDTFHITPAETFIAFTGNAYNTSTTLRLEATVSGQCKLGREVTFAIDLNEDGDYADMGEVVGTAMTNSAGVATLSYTGLASGSVRDVLVSVGATSNCTEAEGTAVIIVAGTGDASNGGGSYNNSGRMNFGYALQVKTDRKSGAKTVSGQVLWQKQGSVRIKGIITGYTTGAYCPTGSSATGTYTCALITGSASISTWNAMTETWERTLTNVAFRIKVLDGGTSVTCLKKGGSCTTNLKPDWFEISIPGQTVEGTGLAGFQIKGGNIVVK